MEIRGSLQESSLPDVMRRIYTERRTGELLVVKDVVRRRVFFDMGRAIFAASNRKGDRLGSFLLRRGDINQTVFEMVNSMIPRGQRFGQMLVEMGILNEEQLAKAVHEQILSMIYALFEWTKGEFEFIERATTNVPPDLKLELSMADIILEGVGRIRDFSVVRRGMGDLNRLIAPTSDPLLRLQQASLRPLERDLLNQITEPADLLSILVFSQQSAAEAIRSVYGLVSAGFLTWLPLLIERTEPVVKVLAVFPETMLEMSLAENSVATLPPPLNVVVVPAVIEESSVQSGQTVAAVSKTQPLPQAASPSPQTTPPHAAQTNDQPPTSNQPTAVTTGTPQTEKTEAERNREAALGREVEQMKMRVRSGDPYTIFGVERSEGLAGFKTAYHQLLRTFHPDKFYQSSQELREDVEQIFKEINAAWSKVQDKLEQAHREKPVQALHPATQFVTPTSGFLVEPGNLQNARADLGAGTEITQAKAAARESSAHTEDAANFDDRGNLIAEVSQESLPNIAEAAYRSGVAKLMSKQFADAIESLRKAVHINPVRPEYHSLLALALSSNSQRSNSKTCREADQHYLEAIKLNPQDPSNHALLGMLYSRLGMARRAEAGYRQALKIDPRNEIARKGLAAEAVDAEVLMHLMART